MKSIPVCTRVTVLVVVAICGISAKPAHAQTSFAGSVDDLKAEVIRRAGINQYPMFGYNSADVKEGASKLASRAEDDWAAAWLPIGDRYLAKAREEEKTNRPAALNDYSADYRLYTLARWPTPTSPRKQEAYKKSFDAFFAWDKLVDLPSEAVRVPFEGK